MICPNLYALKQYNIEKPIEKGVERNMVCDGNSITLYFPANQTNNGWRITYNLNTSDPTNGRVCFDIDKVGNPNDLNHFIVGFDETYCSGFWSH